MLTGLAEEDIELCNTENLNVWKFASVNLPSEILKTDLLKKRDTQLEGKIFYQFPAHYCRDNLSVREITEAKLPEPGGGSIWSAAG
jgi:hypothetical protein